MKKALSILFFLCATVSFTQTITIANFNDGADPPDNMTYGAGNLDWVVDNGTSSGFPVSSGYAGASGSYFLWAADGGDAGSTETVTWQVSTTGYSGISLTWGAYKDNAAFPSITLAYSTDNVTFTPITFTNISAIATWTLVPTITLPAGCNNQATLYLRWSFTDDGNSYSYLFDDIKLFKASAISGSNFFLMF